MRVRCITDISTYPWMFLPLEEDGSMDFVYDVYASPGGMYTIFQELEGFHVTTGKEYTVYGILEHDNQLRYLIQDDRDEVYFLPYVLFEITDMSIPFDWKVNTYTVENGLVLVVGYDDLASTYKGLIDMLRSDMTAIRKFLDYKAYMLDCMQYIN